MAAMAPFSLQIRSAPYARLIKRLLFGQGSLRSAAFREEVLCPEEESVNQPPIYLPGQLDRVSGASEHQPVAAEIASMLATTYKHAATIAYHIKDAIIFDGSMYAGNLKYFLADKSRFASVASARHLKVAGLASSAVGTRYFGHWLLDDCIQYLLAEQIGKPICVSTSFFGHKNAYAAYFDQDWLPTDRALIDELIVYQDFGQNSLKRQRYGTLASRIRAEFPAAHRDKLVYLRRGQTGVSRPIQDEDALLESLSKNGFLIVDVGSNNLNSILKTLTRAKLVVSMEGSQIAHCCYTLEPSCGLLVLQPANRFSAVHRHWAEGRGLQFGFVVGEQNQFGYQFDVDEILSTVDKMLSSS